MSDTKKPAAREGSLDAPFRHPIEWRDEAYYDLAAVEAEMERQFDVCHTCRRCFNLCDSFPRLFDLIDESKTGELDSVPKSEYAKVDEACTLCDMCFLTKCPYVPPHEFDIDIPHLILRNGRLAKPLARIANWGTARKNTPIRKLLDAIAEIDAEAELPKYYGKTASDLLPTPVPPDPAGPAFGKRKVAIYSTCSVEYNGPDTGVAAARVLARQGIEAKVVYPECCGMPQLEGGDLAGVAGKAARVAAVFEPYIDQGYEVVALTASCGLMMKFEWPLILPENAAVAKLGAATRDVCQYIVDLNRDLGLAPGLTPVEGGITVHHSCHARAQNMGARSADMLKLIPDTQVEIVERCSGHGGTFGVMKSTRPLAVKVGRPTARQVAQKGSAELCSDCPLACKHIGQLLADEEATASGPQPRQSHPIEIFARAYGVL